MPKYNDFELDVQSLKIKQPEEDMLPLATGNIKSVCICDVIK